jgi:hypothetical protein
VPVLPRVPGAKGRHDARLLLEAQIFGTEDRDLVASRIDRFCAKQFGAGVDRYEFFATSQMSVHGVRLVDGRRVVIKVGPATMGTELLTAVLQVQSHLANHGFPAPRPLLGPRQLGSGVAIVEELLDRGVCADPHTPPVRRAIATGLARLVEVARPLVAVPGLPANGLVSPARTDLWPEPHDPRFDFRATTTGAEWIDELAKAARQRLVNERSELVVAHSDWRAEHLRFERNKIVASYDYQSLCVGPEPVLVGIVGHAFTADWGIEQARRTPTVGEYTAFIGAYEDARRRPLSSAEHKLADAAWVYATAYGARCEHSDICLGMPWATEDPNPGSYRALLARHGEAMLTRSSASPAASPKP